MTHFIKRVAKAYFRALGYYSTTIKGERFNCDPYHIALWRSASKGVWEPFTYNILQRFLDLRSIYVDVGAWVGPTVIFAARKSKQVYCFEPDYVAYRYLLWNLEINDLRNVMPFNCALAGSTGMRSMVPFWGGAFGTSTSSLIARNQEHPIAVSCMNWSNWLTLTGVEGVSFIKMDIEGGEFELLPSMKDYLARYKPILYLSLHTSFLSPDEQKNKIDQLIDVVSTYGKSFSEDMTPIEFEDLGQPSCIVDSQPSCSWLEQIVYSATHQ